MKTVDSSLIINKVQETKSIRWGILASGGIASLFAREVMQTGGHIEAVASRNLLNAQKFVKNFGNGRYGLNHGEVPASTHCEGGGFINKAYGSYEELINDDEIDAIYIATPNSDHLQWALKCLEGGKNILIEKAITRNKDEAEQIFKLAKEKRLFVMEAMWTRFLPHIIEIKKIISRQDIGEIVNINANFGIRPGYDAQHRLFAPHLAGGGLLDLGIYPISFVHDILGVPDKILASGFGAPTNVDANLSAIFEYKNGAQAIINTTTLSYTSTTAVISGTKGRIEVAAPFYRPSDFKVFLFDNNISYQYSGPKERVDLFGKDGCYGMHFEALEVERCLNNNQLESLDMSWNDSLEIMGIMDNIREQIDFKYPQE